MDFTTTFAAPTTVDVPRRSRLWTLAIEQGDAKTPSVVHIIVRAVDDKGVYDDTVEAKRLTLRDDPVHGVFEASAFMKAMFGALCQADPTDPNDLVTQLGVKGQPVLAAGWAHLRSKGIV
jgi:hypothetical protein